jgi:hypothetical protein
MRQKRRISLVRAKHMVRVFHISCIFLLSACAVPETSPLAPIEGKNITSIEIHEYIVTVGSPTQVQDKIVCIMESADDIQFVKKQLQSLEARRFDHSSPEFDIILKTNTDQSLRLRVSPFEIGPKAPASAYNVHWFPVASKASKFPLYHFLKNQAYGTCKSNSAMP